jgi:hypothetical protein
MLRKLEYQSCIATRGTDLLADGRVRMRDETLEALIVARVS